MGQAGKRGIRSNLRSIADRYIRFRSQQHAQDRHLRLPRHKWGGYTFSGQTLGQLQYGGKTGAERQGQDEQPRGPTIPRPVMAALALDPLDPQTTPGVYKFSTRYNMRAYTWRMERGFTTPITIVAFTGESKHCQQARNLSRELQEPRPWARNGLFPLEWQTPSPVHDGWGVHRYMVLWFEAPAHGDPQKLRRCAVIKSRFLFFPEQLARPYNTDVEQEDFTLHDLARILPEIMDELIVSTRA